MRTALLGLFLPIALTPAAFTQTWVMQTAPGDASLRGVGVVDATRAWASGSSGTVLRTVDGGVTWTRCMVPGIEKLDFRGVQGLADSALLMASGEGPKSALYRTTNAGRNWSALAANPDEKGFFDGLILTAADTAWLLGDPVGGQFALFRVLFGKPALSRVKLPAALPDEGAFAASNTSLFVNGRNLWFGTGGKSGARVFHSPDDGATWSTSSVFHAGSDGAGIFSIAFRDALHGIAAGGDYSKPKDVAHNLAVTADGGKSWSEPPDAKPRGYRSAVAWLPAHRLWIATGPTGSEWSRDDGRHWTAFDDGAFNAIGVGPGDFCVAAGPHGRIATLAFLATPRAR